MILAQRSTNEPTEHNNTIDDSPARHPNIQRNLIYDRGIIANYLYEKKWIFTSYHEKKKHFQIHSGSKYEQQNFDMFTKYKRISHLKNTNIHHQQKG